MTCNDLHRRIAGMAAPLGVLLILGAAAHATPPYTIQDLGTLAGPDNKIDPGSFAFALSSGGTVVGYSVTALPTRNFHGFRWVNGVLTDLPVVGSDAHSMAYAVNATGDAVGVSYALGALDVNGVRWSADGTTTLLGQFEPRDISDSGVVVGALPVAGQLGVTHAIRWVNGAITDLGTLGGSHSAAFAVNEAGWIVGDSTINGSLATRAFLWHDGNMSSLGTLGGASSHALAINDANQVAGLADLADGTPHAVIWQLNGAGQVVSTTDLGVVSGTYSAAYAIDSTGNAVGASDGLAVLWSGGEVFDLNTQIDPLGGWILTRATGISDDGWIVGQGKYLGFPRAFLMKPAGGVFGDLNGDGAVDGADLGLLLAAWGSKGGDADLDGNGMVDGADLGLLLAAWTG
ncbi:MAG: hypothetical protein KDA22_10680 [Phycisphaerales bacterium]|nr:hypothetical protein [Phycisphaerales bacterium]